MKWKDPNDLPKHKELVIVKIKADNNDNMLITDAYYDHEDLKGWYIPVAGCSLTKAVSKSSVVGWIPMPK